jgi:Tfp pilus assembly protein PilV
MMVATIGLIALAELLAVSIRMQQLGRNSMQAVRLAQDKVDELTTMSFATAAAIQCGGSITSNVTNYNDTPTSTTGYTRRWVVSAGPDADLNLRQVTVRVTPIVSDRRIASPFDLTTVIRGVSSPCP